MHFIVHVTEARPDDVGANSGPRWIVVEGSLWEEGILTEKMLHIYLSMNNISSISRMLKKIDEWFFGVTKLNKNLVVYIV